MTANRSAMSTTRIDTQITLFGAALAASRHTPAGAHIGRDDERSSDTRLASVVSRWLGRNVGAWDPA